MRRFASNVYETLTSSTFTLDAPRNSDEVFVSCIDVALFFNNPDAMLIETYLSSATGPDIYLVKLYSVGSNYDPNQFQDYTLVTQEQQFVQYCVNSEPGGVTVPGGQYQWTLKQRSPSGGDSNGRDAFFSRPYSGELGGGLGLRLGLVLGFRV